MGIGKKGEIIVRDWAHEVDLIPNPVENDETGWDLILEFPEKYEVQNLTADLVPKPIQCWIQVKTTQKRDPKWQIKLSNLKRLVDTPLPSFYLELILNENKKCEKATIYHVGEDLICKSLKRLRELGTDWHEKMHKKKMQLPKGNKIELPSADGEGLKRMIEDIVGCDYQGYLDKKKKIKMNCGYEKTNMNVRVSFKIPEDYQGNIEEYLVDFELGIVPEIEIEDFVQENVRFGIPIEINKEEGGRLKITSKSDREIILTIRTKDFREKLKIDSVLQVPSGMHKIVSRENVKLKIFTSNLELIIKPFQNNVSYNITFPGYEEEVKINDLINVSNFIWFLNKMKTYEDKLVMEIDLGKNGSLESTIGTNTNFNDNVLKRALSVRYASTVFNYFDISFDMKFLLNDIITQTEVIHLLSKIINPKHFVISRRYQAKSLIDEDLEGGKTVFIYSYILVFGNTNLWVIIAIRGNSEIVNKNSEIYEFLLESSDITIEDHQLWEGDTDTPPRTIKEALTIIKKKYQDTHQLVINHSMF